MTTVQRNQELTLRGSSRFVKPWMIDGIIDIMGFNVILNDQNSGCGGFWNIIDKTSPNPRHPSINAFGIVEQTRSA
ncbi:hypothetical protein RSOLAG1IB_07410 [Rhizoctonia solani AG-1 IB]|uniref:Uncharacterized protein n=1 Tax=Thanatephorus cucumeris (strain AG1-IB / isolate 7/3/14) TaxID=1108050 RepID=A0A0B7FFD2_THACB|nr:hypothetical protein RSOLAG1IB_07410 [Rhizoctonia solani AG-1 IB]